MSNYESPAQEAEICPEWAEKEAITLNRGSVFCLLLSLISTMFGFSVGGWTLLFMLIVTVTTIAVNFLAIEPRERMLRNPTKWGEQDPFTAYIVWAIPEGKEGIDLRNTRSPEGQR